MQLISPTIRALSVDFAQAFVPPYPRRRWRAHQDKAVSRTRLE